VQQASIVGIQGRNGFVGCGFAVTSRHILTCAHVVNAALERLQEVGKSWPEDEVTVMFPYLGASLLRARVVYWKPQFDEIPSSRLGIEEDVAGLELLDELPILMAVHLKPALSDVLFRAFGYPKKTSQGGVAEGKLQVDLPCGWFQMDATCPEGLWAEAGYSGTAVWDKQDATAIYGMVVARKRDDLSKIAYMIPVQGLENAIAHLKLLEILPCVVTLEAPLGKVYLSAYQRCCPDDWGLGSAHALPETLSEILMQLNEMQPAVTILPAETQVERKLEFVARLLVSLDFEVTELQKEALRAWGIQRLPDFISLLDHVRDIPNVEAVDLVVADPCLMIEVSPNELPYTTKAFFIPDTQIYQSNDSTTWQEIFCWDFKQKQEMVEELEAFEQDDLPEAIERKLKQRLAGYITTCRKKYRKDGKFRIELILPLSLMNEPIERWELEIGGYEGSIVPAAEHPVVIRSYDRTTDEYQEELGELCRVRWANLNANKAQQSATRLAAVVAKAKIPQLKAAYQNPLIVGIKVSDVLPASLQTSFLGTLLATGTPAAVWLRQSLLVQASTIELGGVSINPVLSTLDEFLQCLLSTIPDRALALRAQAIEVSIEPDETNFMVGHHLSLLWENPHLLPPSPPKQASE
jgi:vWA-MoxR associated protein C-terminal domain/vWA-MoxR associated protein middle region (VMAP-M) 1